MQLFARALTSTALVMAWASNYIPHKYKDVIISLYPDISYHTEAERRTPPFRRRRFQMHFRERKYMNFD